MSEPLAISRRRSISASGHGCAELAELVDRAQAELPHLADQGKVAAHLVEPGGVVGSFDDAGDGTRVLEDPLDLVRGTRLVDRHHDRARVEQREVDQRPLVRRACEESDLVAGFDPGRDESLGERDDLTTELRRGDVSPALCPSGTAKSARSGVAATRSSSRSVTLAFGSAGTMAGTSN